MFQATLVGKMKIRIFLKYFFPENLAVYEIMWKNTVESDRPIRRMRTACRITKATDTHSDYLIFIAFPRLQWLRERAALLRYTYIACLVPVTTLQCIQT